VKRGWGRGGHGDGEGSRTEGERREGGQREVRLRGRRGGRFNSRGEVYGWGVLHALWGYCISLCRETRLDFVLSLYCYSLKSSLMGIEVVSTGVSVVKCVPPGEDVFCHPVQFAMADTAGQTHSPVKKFYVVSPNNFLRS